MRVAAIVSIVAGGLVLVGCASARPASPPVSADLSATALAAVAQDGSFAADEVALHRADEILIARCMGSRHQPYTLVPYEPATASSVTDTEAHPDLPWRRTAGYSMRSGFGGPPQGANDRYVATLTSAGQAEWRQALTGDGSAMSSVRVPSGQVFTSTRNGCVAESGRRLYGSAEAANRAYYYLQDVRVRLASSIRGDAEYTAAVGRWAACMRSRGFSYGSAADAQAAIGRDYQQHGVTAAGQSREIAVAVADGECVGSAGLTAVAVRLTRAKAAGYPADVRRTLNTLAEARRTAIARAATVLAGS
ncbi:MAG: hypothetical protein QOI35_2672 [Cryptosporangiaceae bacterium]|jgi:hypothetical protein|nr:hypothetical protein [Cryptosporangiaceae bacterium]